MSRQEDFIDAGIAYRMKHGKPMAIGGDNFAEMAKEMNHCKDYEAGAEYGYQYALQHPHWIPVEERLPEPHFSDTSSKWVLVSIKGSVFIDSYNHKHNEWCNNGTNVTHWMPIVPPRKEDKE